MTEGVTIGDPAPKIARLTVNLPWKVYLALRHLAGYYELNHSEALRRAISTEHFRREIEEKGGVFEIRWKDGSREELRFPY